ncbi:MAG TPA: ABC transporter permease [Vicinamibacterales bacterium]
MLAGLWRDLADAGRSLAKAKSFTLVCVASLGIGMVPVIAIPYASRLSWMPPAGVHTDRLVELDTRTVGPHLATSEWSYPDFEDLRAADTGMTLVGWTGGGVSVEAPGVQRTRAQALFASRNYFTTLNVSLLSGADFDPASEEPVVILGYRFWQDRLGANAEMVGKSITINGVPHRVIGIAPDQFTGHNGFQGSQLFLPLERHPNIQAPSDPSLNFRTDRAREWINIHGQLASNVSVKEASAAVALVTSRLSKNHPATNEFKAGVAVAYDPIGALTRPQFRIIQTVGLTLTGMVLLVVALNISGMMQVRSAMRERELSIRQAIGASRGRLAQFLLSEAIVLACAGGALASVVLFNVPALVSWLNDTPIPAQFQEALRVDASIVAICFGLCLLTSLIFGWLPATRFSRPIIISALKDDAGGGGFRVGRVHRVTAALQVAIAVPLLVMSGQSLDRVRATATGNLGFSFEPLHAVPLNLNGLTKENAGFQVRRLSDTLAHANGVASVTVADGLPLDFKYRMTTVALHADAGSAPNLLRVHVTRVGDGYLETMGIPLVRGRDFTGEDGIGAEPVTIISKPLADRLAPNADVIGKRLMFGADDNTRQALTIVGVVADFPTSQMSTEREQLLLPLAQHPGVRFDSVPAVDDNESGPALMLIARSRAGGQDEGVAAALEQIARELDPEFKPASIVTGIGLQKKSMNDFLTQSTVAGAAGGVILILAALGVYGVVGLMVATRTREIAVRAALGATGWRVIGMVIFDVVKLVTPGVGVGLVLTVVLNRINAENMGVSLSGLEPLAYAGGAVVAVLVAILASFVPARRAASVQPMIAMRSL